MEQSLNITIHLVALALCIWATVKRMGYALMMFQQNSYRADRYRRYLAQSGDNSSYSSLGFLAVMLVCCVRDVPAPMALTLAGVYSLLVAARLSTRHYKKPLVWTPRVRRIFGVMWALVLAVTLIQLFTHPWLYTVYSGCVVMMLASAWPAELAMAANWLLTPVEKRINRRYLDDAARILASMPQLRVVGVTGSYGKTSTKHYLQRILAEKYAVCMTPGSYNTTMGVVRTVREYLKPFDEVFIVEMGAKQPGDIKEICDLVHPSVGVVTAVGEQHLESFKTIENVQRTKFELVDSLPADGLAVVNADFPWAASRPVTNVALQRYGVSTTEAVDIRATDVVYSPRGTEFTVHYPGGEMRLRTRLVGECNISNLLAAVAVGLHLGVTPEQIRYAVEQIEQVEHRLNIKRTPGGINIIDDAFNSNPTGSAMALDVLAAMTSGRRIVITPGMIELGEKQHELNRHFGSLMPGRADVAIVVGEYNREAILEGIGGAEGLEVITAATFAEAQQRLTAMARPADTVLYENDLPDTFK